MEEMKRYAIDFHLEGCIPAEDVESKFPLKIGHYVLFEGFQVLLRDQETLRNVPANPEISDHFLKENQNFLAAGDNSHPVSGSLLILFSGGF